MSRAAKHCLLRSQEFSGGEKQGAGHSEQRCTVSLFSLSGPNESLRQQHSVDTVKLPRNMREVFKTEKKIYVY